MDNISVTTEFSVSRSNLVKLPAEIVSLLYSANINVQDVVIELSWKPNGLSQTVSYAYAGWSGLTSSSFLQQVVQLDPTFANSVGIKEHSKIWLTVKFNPPEATQIHLEPLTSSDWELVDINAKYVEDTLLSHTRAVKLNQILVVYPTPAISANLKVTAIEPTPKNNTKFAKLAPGCKVVVSPKTRISEKESKLSNRSNLTSRAKRMLRNICLPNKLFNISNFNPNLFQVYLNTEDLNSEEFSDYGRILYIFNKSHEEESTEKKGNMNKDDHKNNLKCLSLAVKLIDLPDAPKGFVGIPPLVAQTLSIFNSNNNLVILEAANIRCSLKRPEILVIQPFTISAGTGEEKQNKKKLVSQKHDIEKCLSETGFFESNTISSDVDLPVIPNSLPYGGKLKFKKPNGWMISESITDFKFEIVPPTLKKESEVLNFINDHIENLPLSVQADMFEDRFVGYESLVSDIMKAITSDVNGLLIHGSSGSGKSLLAKVITRNIFLNTTYKVSFMNLEDHLNEVGDIKSLKKTFGKFFQESIKFEKVIFIIDNINLVCFKESEQGGFSLDGNILTKSFTEYLIEFFSTFINKGDDSCYEIKLILTSNSKENLHSLLLSNPLLISKSFKINPPDKSQRSSIINHYLKKKHLVFEDSSEVELNDLLNDTEGYLPSDLKALIDRSYHEVLLDYLNSKKHLNENGDYIILPEHFKKSLEGFTSSGLRNIKLQQSKVKWDDIGGLLKAKEILLETLEWPTKYAPIFANCPLRLRSGILLYGYPGCGKTLLASAVSSQCGLNFISVKGPEILNKYIGASEQSVRELFERAQAAKPCILFFDEFDSIAPKRGHDSTGVTDRVVNQMLTQMDGAEGLDGVYVLAATSRPDLIDSALLRPGRLDKSVICDIPDFADRLDILNTVSAKMSLKSDVNLSIISQNTNGFSGADLQALCYNAYLNAVHRKLKRDSEEGSSTSDSKTDRKSFEFFQLRLSDGQLEELSLQEKSKLHRKIYELLETNNNYKKTIIEKKIKKDFNVIIKTEDFEFALKDTSPSISASEKLKLQRIYKEFVADRDGNMPDGSASNQIGGRTTLM